jgi:hypothetical protein
MARCIHCLGRVEPPAEVCEACVDLLSDLGEEDEPPPQAPPVGPQPAPVNHTGRFEPTPEDWAAYRELSERGSFRPFDQVRAKQPPSWSRNKWGKAIASTSRRDPDIPKQ